MAYPISMSQSHSRQSARHQHRGEGARVAGYIFHGEDGDLSIDGSSGTLFVCGRICN